MGHITLSGSGANTWTLLGAKKAPDAANFNALLQCTVSCAIRIYDGLDNSGDLLFETSLKSCPSVINIGDLRFASGNLAVYTLVNGATSPVDLTLFIRRD